MLERASKKIEAIKKLDREIIELNKVALQLANGNVGIGLSLAIEDFDKTAELESKKANGSAEYVGIFSQMMLSYYPYGSKKEDESAVSAYKAVVSSSTGLQLLAVLLADKMAKRQELIDNLQRMGFHI